MTKLCLRCDAIKPIEAFSKNKNRRDGLQAYCKVCSKAANHAYEGKNKARSVVNYPVSKVCASCGEDKPADMYFKDKRRKDGLYSNCKACHTPITTLWKKRNPHTEKEIQQRTYVKYADKNREYARQWHLKNSDRSNANSRAWKLANRAHATALELKRSKRQREAPGEMTALKVLARWDYYGGKCWMCGEDAAETDHVKPLCAGGSNWPSNLRPACQKCNRTKNGTWPYPTATYRALRLVR